MVQVFPPCRSIESLIYNGGNVFQSWVLFYSINFLFSWLTSLFIEGSKVLIVWLQNNVAGGMLFFGSGDVQMANNARWGVIVAFQCFFYAFLNCLNCPFDLSITFGIVPLFQESFECVCCEFWTIVWDDYFGYSIFRKKVFCMYCYHGGEFIWQLTDIEEVGGIVNHG